MSRQRIANVGLGMAVTPQARGLMDLADRIEVLHAFAPSAARHAAFAERFPFPPADSLGTILADHRVETVTVFTPASSLAEIARACARAGKHALVEKLLDVTTALELKSGEFRSSPFPGQTHPTASVTGMPSAVKPSRTARRTRNSATRRWKSRADRR